MTHLLALGAGAFAFRLRETPTGTTVPQQPASRQARQEIDPSHYDPENSSYVRSVRAHNRLEDEQIANRLAAVRDFPGELNRVLAVLEAGAGDSQDAGFFAEAFKRWMREDADQALAWLGNAKLKSNAHFNAYPLIICGHDPAAFAHAILAWPEEGRRERLKTIGEGANNPERLPSMFAVFTDPKDRAALLGGAVLREPLSNASKWLPLFHSLPDAERSNLETGVTKRLRELDPSQKYPQEELDALSKHPAFHNAVQDFERRQLKQGLETLAESDPSQATQRMEALLREEGASDSKIRAHIESLWNSSADPHQDFTFFNDLQAAALGEGDVETALREFARRHSRPGTPCPDEQISRAAAFAFSIEPLSVTGVAYELASPEVVTDRLASGDSDFPPMFIDSLLAKGMWSDPRLVTKYSNPAKMTESSSARWFTDNETAALDWALSLKHPEARTAALQGICSSLRSEGREQEANRIEGIGQ